MKFLPVTHESLKHGAEILKNGGLVAFPTETVYGLGADAYNPQALAKIFEVKNRPFFDPLIIHIASIDTLEKIANLSLLKKETRKKLFLLAENLWPGPLSIILPKNEKIPGIATAGLQTAAFRFPSHDAAQKLISLSSGAIAAPSANPFGSLSPTKAEHVRDKLGEKIDMILDGGPACIGLESTVLDLTSEPVKILRPGGTPKKSIEDLIGTIESFSSIAGNTRDTGDIKNLNDKDLKTDDLKIYDTKTYDTKAGDEPKGFASPGQLKSHYAPGTPLFVYKREDIICMNYRTDQNIDENEKTAFLFFDSLTKDEWLKTQKQSDKEIVKVLSEKGDIIEAASRLFEILHELDNCKVSKIIAQLAPNEGLGEAINDRLKRGAFK